MPIHLAANSRRDFLKSISACGAAAVLAQSKRARSAEPQHPNFIALLSDTHIPDRPDVSARGVNMTDNLRRVLAEIASLTTRPANLFINGDCAYLKGLPADYANLADCLTPLESLGIDLHLTMGNHDDRQPLYQALSGQRPAATAVASRHVSVVLGEFANWFLLDTLFQVNVVTGQIGDEQLQWLAKQLSAHNDKPAVIMAHHNPQFTQPQGGKAWSGISDTSALFELLDATDHVRAFIYGHTHTWNLEERGHIKLVNLPPVGYVFAEGQPNGWVSANLSREGMRLQLQALDANHPRAQETVEVSWG